MSDVPYAAIRYLKREDANIDWCYLCGDQLEGELNEDHIIPTNLFPAGAGYRPKIVVHKKCNTGKSMVDERFKFRLLMLCSLNPIAGQKLMAELLSPSAQQREYANLIGYNKKIPKYKLAKKLARDLQHQLTLKYRGEHIVMLKTSDSYRSELDEYAKKMVQGLLVRNVPGIKPGEPVLKWVDRTLSDIRGQAQDEDLKAINRLIVDAHRAGTLFAQSWKDHLEYAGSGYAEDNQAGFIWIEFYRTYGLLAICSGTKR